MTESSLAHAGRSAGLRPGRVLVFNVDDALFALPIDWIAATVSRSPSSLHTVKNGDGRSHSFVIAGGEAALVVDLRDAFGLTPLLGPAVRREVLVVRGASLSLAIPVDGCAGLRELDLDRQPPVPSSLVRDGGFPAGHLVELDGRPLIVLDPTHLLDASERASLVPLMQKVRAFQERRLKSEALWSEICARPAESSLRTYARLCSRNGRTKAAAAARLVVRHLEQRAQSEETPEAEVPLSERLVRELVCLAAEAVSGDLIVPQSGGEEESRVAFVNGRVVQAFHRRDRGRTAFKQLLAASPEHFYFVERTTAPSDQSITESTLALLVGTLEALGHERRPHRGRSLNS